MPQLIIDIIDQMLCWLFQLYEAMGRTKRKQTQRVNRQICADESISIAQQLLKIKGLVELRQAWRRQVVKNIPFWLSRSQVLPKLQDSTGTAKC